MPESFSYLRANGTAFSILLEDAPVPPDASDWGFLFRVTETATGLKHTYRGLFEKKEFPTKDGAAAFATGDALAYLKSAFLDRCINGSHAVLWPVVKDGWVVFRNR